MTAALLTHGADVHAKEANVGYGGRSLFGGDGRRVPRRHGRPGPDRCNADRDARTRQAHTHAHACKRRLKQSSPALYTVLERCTHALSTKGELWPMVGMQSLVHVHA